MMTGSNEVSHCYTKCPVGQYFDVTRGGCVLCDIGYYQDKVGSFYCEPCGAGYTTEFTGTNSSARCTDTCDHGYQLNGLGNCVPCSIGTYRNATLHSLCQTCTTGFISATVAAKSVAECTVAACEPGRYLNTTLNQCFPCTKGYYQNLQWQKSCNICNATMPDRYTTVNTGTISKLDCIFFCPSGYEVQSEGVCVPCTEFKYKDNADDFRSLCRSCPFGYRAPMPASTKVTDCTIWECQPGYEDVSGLCQPCQRGYYKPELAAAACTRCPTGTTTESTGASNSVQCSLLVCPKGTYIKTVSSSLVCELCPVGKYSDTVMQDVCTSCTTAKTTHTTGTTTSLDCIDDCDAGYGYDTTVQACRICPVNFFNSKADPYPNTCKLCPYNRTNTISGSSDCTLTVSDPVSPPVQLVTITVLTIYQLNVDNCDTFSTITSGIMRTQVKTKLVQIFEEKAAGFANNWCSGVGCPNIDVVYTSCSAAVDASRRKRALVNSNFELIFRNISKLVTDSENGAVILAKEILAQTLMIKARSLDLEGGINFIGFERFVVSELCLPGQYRSGIECIPCPQGTYSRGGNHAQCTPCQLNYYQDLTGTAGCKPCPALKYTDTTGSVSSDVCKVQDEISLTKVIVPVVISILVVVAVIVVVIAYRRGLFGKVFTGNRQRNSTNRPSQDTPRIPRIELPYVDLQRGSTNVSSDYCELDSVQRPASQDTPSTELPYVDLQRGSMNVSSEYSKLDSEQRPAMQYQTAREIYDNT